MFDVEVSFERDSQSNPFLLPTSLFGFHPSKWTAALLAKENTITVLIAFFNCHLDYFYTWVSISNEALSI